MLRLLVHDCGRSLKRQSAKGAVIASINENHMGEDNLT